MRNPYRVLYYVAVAILVLFSFTSIVRGAQGDENLPCVNGGQFNLLHLDKDAPTPSFVGLTFLSRQGTNVHYTSGPLTKTEFDAIIAQSDDLVLSHCLEGQSSPSASPSVDPSPDPTPSATPVSTESEAPVVTPSPSVDPTPEQSIDVPQTATPRPSIPNTAIAPEVMDPDSAGATIATLFGGLLLGTVTLLLLGRKASKR